MTSFYFIIQDPILWPLFIGCLSLCVGSFLNVVVYRLPIMINNNERAIAQQWDNGQKPMADPGSYNLCFPRSRCPSCGTILTAKDNIPLVSWLLLSGRCRYCRQPISARYPLVELATLLIGLLLSFLFPAGAQLVGMLLLSWFLIALTLIDYDNLLLPDNLTLSLLWIGLLFNRSASYIELSDAVLGAIAGYLLLWSFFWGFKIVTGKNGLGYGDFKLLAALGAWLGWFALPYLLLIAAVTGLIIIVLARFFAKRPLQKPLPFGPFLALAGWLLMLYQHARIPL